MSSESPTPLRRRSASSATSEDVAAYCARPSCQHEFRRAIQPGHPQLYCGEPCRRQANQEERRIRSRLRDLESTVAQQHKLLAAYSSTAEAATNRAEIMAVATRAVDRAGGSIRFLANDKSLVADEFRALYAAVAPLIEPGRTDDGG